MAGDKEGWAAQMHQHATYARLAMPCGRVGTPGSISV